MQDHRLTGSQDPAAPLLFFGPGDDTLCLGLAQGLGGQALALDPVGLGSALRAGRQAIALWRGPEARLALCAARGQAISRALDDWRTEARSLLVLFRQNRRRLVLLDAGGLDRGGLRALCAHLGRAEPQDPLPAPAISPLGVVLARLAAHGDADLRQLIDELHASSLPCTDLSLAEVMEGAAAEFADLHQTLGATNDDLAQVRAQLSEEARISASRDAEADLLRGQLDLAAQALAELDQSSAAAAEVARLRIQVLEDHSTAQDLTLAELASQVQALQAELAQTQADLARQEAATQDAQAALAKAQAERAARQAEVASLTARLDSSLADAALLRQQIDVSGAAMAQLEQASQSASDLAAVRIKALEEQLRLQDLTLAERAQLVETRDKDLASLRDQTARLEAELAALRARPAAPDPQESELLLTQLGLMQDLLATGAAPAAPPANTNADPAPRTEAWDKALAKALASARSEAEQRSRLERELRLLRAETQSRTRREEDVAHNRKLFAMMTTEANAALDEIARLSQAKKPAVARPEGAAGKGQPAQGPQKGGRQAGQKS